MRHIKIFLIVFVCMCMFNITDSYAYTLPDFDNIIKNDDGTEKYYFIKSVNYHSDDNSEKSYVLVVAQNNNKPMKIMQFNASTGTYCQTSQATSYYYSQYVCEYGSASWTHEKSGSGFLSFGVPIEEYQDGQEYDEIILYSNFDLIFGDKTVFQSPRTLAKIFQVLPTTLGTGVMRQVVYLIPCLISLVIGLIALRKAYKWLKTVLST